MCCACTGYKANCAKSFCWARSFSSKSTCPFCFCCRNSISTGTCSRGKTMAWEQQPNGSLNTPGDGGNTDALPHWKNSMTNAGLMIATSISIVIGSKNLRARLHLLFTRYAGAEIQNAIPIIIQNSWLPPTWRLAHPIDRSWLNSRKKSHEDGSLPCDVICRRPRRVLTSHPWASRMSSSNMPTNGVPVL